MFALLYKYVPTGTKGEFSYKVIRAIESNDADLMRKLLLWNTFVGAFSKECADFIPFARDVIAIIMKKQNTRMLSAILEHDPFPQILKNQVDLRTINEATEKFLVTVFNRSVEQQKIIEILSLFLDHGLNDARMKNGYTPLWLAVKNGMVGVAKFLIHAGANVHVRSILDDSLIFVLLEDERVSARGQAKTKGFIKETNAELMKLLLSAGIRIDLKCCGGVSPLTFTVVNNLLYVLPFLQEHARAVNFKDAMERSIFELYLHAIPTISQKWDLRPKLYEAKSSAFKILLSNCSNMNVCNDRGDTPLLHAIINHYADGNVICNEESYVIIDVHYDAMCEEMVGLLLSKGADIHQKNSNGMTPIHLAAKYKHINLLLMFQEHGADFNQRTNIIGDNMLHLVAKHRTHVNANINRVVTEFLIVNGCDLNARNNAGITPLLYALKMNNASIIAETLLEYGADVNCYDQFGSTPLHAAVQLDYDQVLPLLIERAAELDCKHLKSQMTPLHLAVKRNRLDVVKRLIKAGADFRVRQKNGRIVLHLAAFCNNSSAIVILLEAGVPVNAKDDNGVTILRDVIEYDNTAGFEAMIKYNFDLNQIDAHRDIFSILNFQTKEVWNEIVKHLLKRKAINLYVSDIYNPYVSTLNQELQRYFEECFKEVQSLKRKEAIDQISFYDLLRMNPKKRFFHIKKKAFKMKIYNYEKLSNEFPEYASLIVASYFEAVSIDERIRLEKSVAEVWYELTRIYLDDICVERIISYLDSFTLERIDREYKNTDFTETQS